MRLSRWLAKRALGVAGVGLLSTHAAAADVTDGSFRLAWARGEGAAACVDQPGLEASVRARLKRDPFDAQATRSIEGAIRWEGGAYHVDLQVMQTGQVTLGRRSLQLATPDCSELSEAIALAVALTIDPDAERQPASAAPSAVPSEPPLSPPAPPPPRAATSNASEGRPVMLPPMPSGPGFWLALRGAGALGVLPGFAAGSALEAAISGPSLAFTLGAAWFAERRDASDRFGFGLATLSSGACWSFWRHRQAASAAVCAAGEVGAMHSVVYALEPLDPGARWFLAANVTPLFRVAVAGSLQLELGLQAKVPLLRPAFGIQGQADPIFEPSAVAGVGMLGLVWSVPSPQTAAASSQAKPGLRRAERPASMHSPW